MGSSIFADKIRSGGAASPAWLAVAAGVVATLGSWFIGRMQPPQWYPLFGVAVLLAALALAVLILAIPSSSVEPPRYLRFVTVLSPTALLMAAFAFSYNDIAYVEIAGMSSLLMLLCVSVTLPWAASAVARPLYAPVNEALGRAEENANLSREVRDSMATQAFLKEWPIVLLWSLVITCLFQLVFTVMLAESFEAGLLYGLGLFINTVFAQSLIPLQEMHRYSIVLLSWVSYAAVITFIPQWWLLAPVAGLIPPAAVFIAALRADSGTAKTSSATHRQVLRDMAQGLATGSVLWADKFFLVFVLGPEAFSYVFMLYVCLLPVLLGTAMYWARQHLYIQAAVTKMWEVLGSTAAGSLATVMRGLTAPVDKAMALTLIPMSIGGVGIMMIVPALGFEYRVELLLFLLVPMVGVVLMFINHDLEQLRQSNSAALTGLAHIVACLSFGFLPVVGAYAVLIVVDVLAIICAVAVRAHAFERAPYQLFWKQAVSL